MKKALIVGIDYYEDVPPLYGCVKDAHSVKAVLDRHANGTVNFTSKLLVGTGENEKVSRVKLKEAIKELFFDSSKIALFYFAGHGFIESSGGYLVTSDTKTGDDGIALSEIVKYANDSPALNKIIILDSCHSGVAGDSNVSGYSVLANGVTILTASTAEQYATEMDGGGLFTTLLVDALNGAACNLVGDITPGSVYAHIDQSLGPWEQRPVFKTNVKSFVSLRKGQPPVAFSDLQRLPKLFPEEPFEYSLDSSCEPTSSDPDQVKTEEFGVLQRLRDVNLVAPVNEAHMYDAAMNDGSCKLTVLGEHYRRLVVKERI